MTLERILRAAALLIAILAFIDPALTRAAQGRQTVVVMNASSSDRRLAADVAAALQPAFDVSRADVPGAAAYVVAGPDLPEDWLPPADARVFSVVPAATDLGLKILHLKAPEAVSIDSIATIEAHIQVNGSGERDVVVTLLADGVRLSPLPHRLAGSDTQIRVPLTFVPTRAGVVRLRVEAGMPGREAVVADHVLEVNARVWNVLAFDGRPSYAATFVRRALEPDPRFKVTSRVVTSRASAIETNAAPSTLTDNTSLAAFDLVIVGATDTFGEREAGALQRYLRERHGAVILLPEAPQGTLLARLTGQGAWQDDRRSDAVPVNPTSGLSSGGSDAWSAAEFLWPARWPPLATPLATVSARTPGAAVRPAVWQIPFGGGRLVVSGAVDGWRSRAGLAAGFSSFWRATAAAMAQVTPPVVDVSLDRRLLTPGQWAEVSVWMFTGGEPAARIVSSLAESRVRLWPVNAPSAGTGREWSGAFRAPDSPGRYRLDVTAGGGVSGSAEFVVVADDVAESPTPAALDRNGLSGLAASSHRGRIVPADQLAALPAQISEVASSPPVQAQWHPMRSIWWLMPFTLCAAGEWWLRRHRGER